MNLSSLVKIRKLYSQLIISVFLCTSVIANPQSSSVYVKTRLDITLEQLSHQLDIPSDYLADLNDCDINRKFSNNEWVAIPAKSLKAIRFIVALDNSEIRRTPPKLFEQLRARNAGLIVDKSLQDLVREGTITMANGLFQGRELTAKVKGICSELSTHQGEVDATPNPSIQRLMALQRRNASRDACNIEKAESDRRIQAERISEIRRNRLNWKTYGDVQIPWGLWFEPLVGKRVNGFLVSSNGIIWGRRSIENYGATGAPNGISVSCSTGTFSINTNPNWNRVQSGWTEWAAPARNSNWERIVIDLCSPVVNR